MAKAGIPRRWRIFAEHLLRDPNATKAAIAAGAKESNARRWGCKLKQKPRFAEYFAERLAEAEEAAQIQTHRVLQELRAIAHSSIDHYEVDWEQEKVRLREGAPEDALRAIAGVKFRRFEQRHRNGEVTATITCEIKLWDKNTALTNAMKHKALLTERVEHSGPNGGPIPHSIAVRFVEPAGAASE